MECRGSVYEFNELIPQDTDPARIGAMRVTRSPVSRPSWPWATVFPAHPRIAAMKSRRWPNNVQVMTGVLGYDSLWRAGRRLGRGR